jgi:hypothetical protein
LSEPSSTPEQPQTPVPSGYLPPQAAFQPSYPAGPAGEDPLIGVGGAGVGGWISRITATIRRSWRSLFAIFTLTQALPGLLLAVLVLLGVGGAGVSDFAFRFEEDGSLVLPEAFAVLALAAALSSLVAMVLQVVGYGAATYATTREAAGIQVRLGEALRYGVRRCLGLLGWILLAGLLYLLALVAVVGCAVGLTGGGISSGVVMLAFVVSIPISVYAWMLIAMIGPAYLFERGNALGKGFRLVHGGFGLVLGRLFLLFLVLVLGSCVTNTLSSTADKLATGDIAAQLVVGVVFAVIVTAVELPLTVVQFTGVLLTYTERRGDTEVISTGLLVAELDGASSTPPPHQWEPVRPH